MKAIVNTSANRLEMLEYPLPQPGRGQVRIRTGACGICATDMEMIAGWDIQKMLLFQPTILDHVH